MRERRSSRQPVTGSRSYVLLCRHGERADGSSTVARGGLSEAGARDIRSVVDKLKETLARPITPGAADRVCVSAVVTAPTPEARATARLIQRALPSTVEVTVEKWLDPTFAWDDENGGIVQFEACLKAHDESAGQGTALLVVGHTPQLSWFADEVLERPYALARGEIVCVGRPQRRWDVLWRRRGWIPWSISPTDEATRTALVAKVRSKMDIAKLYSVVIAFALGIILDQGKIVEATGNGSADRVMGEVATLLFLAGFALYLATLYAYDRLLMPTRFWSQKRKRAWRAGRWLPARPPSSSNLVLYENMMRIWRWMFTPATALIGGGLVLLAIAAADPTWPLGVLIPALTALLLIAWIWFFRPMLGAED